MDDWTGTDHGFMCGLVRTGDPAAGRNSSGSGFIEEDDNERLPSYNYILWRFWIWDIEKFKRNHPELN